MGAGIFAAERVNMRGVEACRALATHCKPITTQVADAKPQNRHLAASLAGNPRTALWSFLGRRRALPHCQAYLGPLPLGCEGVQFTTVLKPDVVFRRLMLLERALSGTGKVGLARRGRARDPVRGHAAAQHAYSCRSREIGMTTAALTAPAYVESYLVLHAPLDAIHGYMALKADEDDLGPRLYCEFKRSHRPARSSLQLSARRRSRGMDLPPADGAFSIEDVAAMLGELRVDPNLVDSAKARTGNR